MFSLGGPKLKAINNGTTSAPKGMPLKDLTSDNNSSFAMGRMLYSKSTETITTDAQKTQKKWFGNRDGSDVVQRRKLNAIGKNSLNMNSNTLSFVNTNDKNDARQALAKTRKSGGGIPKKVTGSTDIYR
tara:strand:+ start:2630 stop:3016 length:387 start_codon:yes stop_codon:yes gene_type:complete